MSVAADARRVRRRVRPTTFTAAAIGVVMTLALVGANFPIEPIRAATARFRARVLASVAPTPNAFGASGEVRVRFALPASPIVFPLKVTGDPSALSYEWLATDDSLPAELARPLEGAEVITPDRPGFYRLALVAGAARRIVEGMTIGVLVPFEEKRGRALNGYRMGYWRGERGSAESVPAGFIQIRSQDAELSLTRHLRVSDFLTRDNQSLWPRYVAVDGRLLDKLELVLEVLERTQGGPAVGAAAPRFSIEVRSGFRTPLHNAVVSRAARDSRHQYGEAVDVAIDADRDGRFTLKDLKLVVRAVEEVEAQHPELAGGLGLYTSRRFSSPYVHIDVRGDAVRWRG